MEKEYYKPSPYYLTRREQIVLRVAEFIHNSQEGVGYWNFDNPLFSSSEKAVKIADDLIAKMDRKEKVVKSKSSTPQIIVVNEGGKKIELHNYDNLSEEQVGAGYRLLFKDEIKDRMESDKIEMWDSNLLCFEAGFCGADKFGTYRTKLSREEVAKLPIEVNNKKVNNF